MKASSKRSVTQKKGIGETELNDLEFQLNVKLDYQYRELFKLVNAPQFGEWLFYPVKDKKNLRKTFDDVVKNTLEARTLGLSEKYYVIAENGTGNYLCMASNCEEVYHKHHEKELPEFVFSNLKEFIENSDNFIS